MHRRRPIVALITAGALVGSTAGCRRGSSAPPPAAGADAAAAAPLSLSLAQYAPRSMLHAAARPVRRAAFPVIDFHQHTNDHLDGERLPHPVDRLLQVMDGANVRTMVVLTGPRGPHLEGLLAALVKPHPGRFVVFTQIDWWAIDRPNFVEAAVAQLRADVGRGARGLKVLKDLGLYLKDRGGRLVAVDDPRFDPIWAACATLGIPVAIHTGDPEAFFLPPDRHNERYEELQAHPEWRFDRARVPPLPELLAARDRVFARHPRTTFVALHVGGWPENLDYVSQLLDRHPNVFVELGARQAELGRQPRRARQLFLRHPDRILFGTDFAPTPEMYASHFRWLETADEYFPYHRYPEQGRWHIYGLDLPPAVLENVYRLNAERLLGKR